MVDKTKFLAEEAQGYRFTIYGKSVLVTEAMKNYVKDKLVKIERLKDHIMDIHVYMDIQRLEHVISVLVKFEHFQIKVGASSSDMYASIDEAVTRLQRKLRRWKGRIQDHNAKKLNVIDMTVNVLHRPYNLLDEINGDIEAQRRHEEEEVYQTPKVIGSEKMPLKTLTNEEAVMKMELSDDPFLVFRGEEDRKLKVIFRRDDGNYGLILPE